MGNKISLFVVLVVFCFSGFSKSSVNASHSTLLGVDNWSLPQDSQALMNSLLIDYQVDYDIAMAVGNPVEIASSLHKIGLVYYHLEQYDLATNYSWRLLNVANKYDLTTSTLYSYAMLVKIHEIKGQKQKSHRYLQKYEQTLALLDKNKIDKPVLADHNYQLLDIEVDSNDAPNESFTPVPEASVPLKGLEVKSSFVNQKTWWLLAIGLALFSVLLLWKKGVLIQSNVHIYESDTKESTAATISKPEKLEFVSSPNKQSKTEILTSNEPVELKSVLPESSYKENIFIEPKQVEVSKPVIPVHSKSFKTKMEDSLVKAKQKNVEIYSQKGLGEINVPTNIEERFDLFVNEVVNVISRSNNIKNTSIQIINSPNVMMVVFLFNPVNKTEQIIELSRLALLSKKYSNLIDFKFLSQEVLGGMLKLSLKNNNLTKG